MKSNFLKRFISSIILLPILLLLVYYGNFYYELLLIIIFIAGSKEIFYLNHKLSKIFVFVLFVFFLIASYKLRNFKNGLEITFLVIIITILSDTGGYFFGKMFGKKKINFISPNKTYEGFLGSLLFAQLIFLYVIHFNIILFDSLIMTSVFFFISSLFVILGDLFFSYCKRINKIKDFSKIFPGHGGLFDRIDGMIFITIFYYFYFK